MCSKLRMHRIALSGGKFRHSDLGKKKVCHYLPNEFIIVKGSTMVYSEYARFDRYIDEWSDCQQVPVTFAFILITMTWVRKRNFEFYILNIRKALFHFQAGAGLVTLGGCCLGIGICCFVCFN